MIDTKRYIGKIVTVKIDRALGSLHPEYGHKYPLNYGFIPNTVSGDGEELDAYILGVNKALKEFRGKCIAIIHRLNDNDDKLIIAPTGINFTDEEIKELTNFQEKWFEIEILR